MFGYHPLLKIKKINVNVESYLNEIGEITCWLSNSTSVCTTLGVMVNQQMWFVKYSNVPQFITCLKQAVRFHTAVQHDSIPHLRNVFNTPDEFVLVYDWVDGTSLRIAWELLSIGIHPLVSEEIHPLDRFCALPATEIMDALDTIYDAHLVIAAKGFIAEDFYEGSMLYNFKEKKIYLCDFDLYHPGPFINEHNQLCGSTLFMAPEELQKGERIDETTNVFTLGRAAFVLLAGSSDSKDYWRGTEAMWQVAKRATSEDRRLRYQSIQDFVEAWRTAVAVNSVL